MDTTREVVARVTAADRIIVTERLTTVMQREAEIRAERVGGAVRVRIDTRRMGGGIDMTPDECRAFAAILTRLAAAADQLATPESSAI